MLRHRWRVVCTKAVEQVGQVSMKGWLLIETLLVLLANAITWLVVAMRWP